MITVTNLFYWLSFAAFYSAVDEARVHSLERGPSAFTELARYARTLPGEAYSAFAPRLLRCARALRLEHLVLRLLPPPSPSVASAVAGLLLATQRGALAEHATVSAAALIAVFGMTPPAGALRPPGLAPARSTPLLLILSSGLRALLQPALHCAGVPWTRCFISTILSSLQVIVL